MANITDEELTKIRDALAMVRDALTPDQSPEATQIKEKIVEAEQIVSAKLGKDGAMVVGGSGSRLQSTKGLFEMFHLENRVV
jgi:hypothetical protein